MLFLSFFFIPLPQAESTSDSLNSASPEKISNRSAMLIHLYTADNIRSVPDDPLRLVFPVAIGVGSMTKGPPVGGEREREPPRWLPPGVRQPCDRFFHLCCLDF